MKKSLAALVALSCFLFAFGTILPNESGNYPPPPMVASAPNL